MRRPLLGLTFWNLHKPDMHKISQPFHRLLSNFRINFHMNIKYHCMLNHRNIKTQGITTAISLLYWAR